MAGRTCPPKPSACRTRPARDDIDEWTDQGIWQQIHDLFLAKLRGADLLDWSRVLVDCSLVKAPLGVILKWLGIEPLLPRRGDDERGLGVWRWFVERTISWLHQFRRLRTRWDRRPEIHQAFLSLAASVICYRIRINES